MKIDALGVASSDFKKTVQFYELLGFSFPPFTDEDKHLEANAKPGEVRFMIDDKALIKEMMGREAKPATHSAFALLCESPEEVNTIAAKVKAAGYTIVKEPWDAFWGQRYAIVADPDGYEIDLFAPLK